MMNSTQLSRQELIRMAAIRFLLSIFVLAAMLFLPAGSLAYWEGWTYMFVLFVPVFLVMVYLLNNDPGLLERRMRMREKEAEQKLIITIGYLYFFIVFLIPGFDHRFDWSQVPVFLVAIADALVLIGYGLFFMVLRENSYASRIIEVEQGQELIDTGPYAVVRHPMYLAASLMYVFSPLALGSYWAVIPATLIIPILIARIINEEKVLLRDLQGYSDYVQKTRYRLLPGVW